MEIGIKRYSKWAKALLTMTISLARNNLFLSETKIGKARSCELIRIELQTEIPTKHLA